MKSYQKNAFVTPLKPIFFDLYHVLFTWIHYMIQSSANYLARVKLVPHHLSTVLLVDLLQAIFCAHPHEIFHQVFNSSLLSRCRRRTALPASIQQNISFWYLLTITSNLVSLFEELLCHLVPLFGAKSLGRNLAPLGLFDHVIHPFLHMGPSVEIPS